MLSNRFWGKVSKAGPDDCWPWTAAPDSSGYGVFSIRKPDGSQTTAKAHRLVYEDLHGVLPPGIKVCHSCDNPPCCNPAHLWPGTHLDNMRDRNEKGRAKGVHPGEAHGRAKLTDAKVREARKRWRRGETTEQLAKEFGVSKGVMYKAIDGQTWTHVV